MKLHFLGGASCVTGSKYLLESDDCRILIDCGLFQGIKDLRLKNWEPITPDPETVDAIILTHAHLDHSGYIPRFISHGFNGTVYSTEATKELCNILLPDSGHLQEEEANYRNKRGRTKHSPALPLYTEDEAQVSLRSFRTQPTGKTFHVGPFQLTFRDAGHILGASSVLVECEGKSLLFSGDLGRFDDPLMTAPAMCPEVDYVIMESTYGDRNHPKDDPVETISLILRDMIKENGVLMIPSFAVGRAQTLLYILHQIFEKYPELKIPVFLNSPMATDVTVLFRKYLKEHKLESQECQSVCNVAHFVSSVDESIELNKQDGPMIIISASGMLTGGRILHHLKAFGGYAKNHILLAGFQAPGTRGYTISAGSKELKIHGQYLEIKAQVDQINALSAHADQEDLLHWLSPLKSKLPKKIFLVHGEPAASDTLRLKVKDNLGLEPHIPHLGETIEL
jgi:metallo-beta-lactamase family protein